ncbi:MAG: HAMP domain-containing sensor histidine kinase [Bacteroidia bacterium]
MQIIDFAPIVLGVFAYLLGASVDRRIALERTAQDAAAEKAKLQEELAVRLQTQNDELRELNATLDGLVYTASHDLKTPVINLDSMVRMLRQVAGQPGSEAMVQSILERMDAATARFNLTISNLLEVSRAARNEEVHLHPVSLSQTMVRVKEHLLEHLGTQGGDLVLDLQVDQVMGTDETVENVFQNLISNAIKFRDLSRPPVVRIESRQLNNGVEVKVIDNGLGIDLVAQGAKVFRMFQRIHGIGEGSGVGLFIVRRTLQRLGGTVDVESTPGIGTTFVLLFQNANLE